MHTFAFAEHVHAGALKKHASPSQTRNLEPLEGRFHSAQRINFPNNVLTFLSEYQLLASWRQFRYSHPGRRGRSTSRNGHTPLFLLKND